MKLPTTLQGVFNRAYKGLRKQNWERSASLIGCMYRGPNGRKCAIGHVIDNSMAVLGDIKGADVPVDAVANACGQPYGVIEELRNVHDLSFTPKQMETAMRRFAKHYELTVPK